MTSQELNSINEIAWKAVNDYIDLCKKEDEKVRLMFEHTNNEVKRLHDEIEKINSSLEGNKEEFSNLLLNNLSKIINKHLEHECNDY
jgi:Mg2+ and Co2+ transporter CorA